MSSIKTSKSSLKDIYKIYYISVTVYSILRTRKEKVPDIYRTKFYGELNAVVLN